MASKLYHVQDTVMALLNKPTYTQRLFLWLLGYSLLMMGCFIAFQYHREKVFKAEELNYQLQSLNKFIINEIKETHNIDSVGNDRHFYANNLRVSIFDETGRAVFDNSLPALPLGNHSNREEIAKAMKHGEGYAVRRQSQSTGQTYFYSAMRAENGMIVRTATPYSVPLSELLQADYSFLWVMCGITIIMCIFGFFATRRVGMHLSRLNDFAKSVEKGDRISDSDPFPHDELGEISNHIVRLYSRLLQANEARDREHKKALHEQREKERIKKQLTNNINHELKTPVASIRVCLETLLTHRNLNEDKRNEFLQRCLSNTERLKHLLDDISLITRMDDGGEAIEKSPVNLSEIISEAIDDRDPIAAEKGVTIENYINRDIELNGNSSLLFSIFHNLIDNAIAYSGGSLVEIKLLKDDNEKVTITLSDNGCGVADNHIPRLFERFYRVDKGRSRAAGGTGLGLAIVKNAVLFHDGIIRVENRIEGGLCFTITLAKRS